MTDSTRPSAPKVLAGRIRRAADEDVDPIEPLSIRRAVIRPNLYDVREQPVDPDPLTVPETAPVFQDLETPSTPPATHAAPRRTRRQEVVVQLGTRVKLETRDLLDDIAEREGITIRHALEKAIESYAARQ